MRLTVEEKPETIRRYAHLRPAGVPRRRRCRQVCPGTERTCSQKQGHRGPHVAHGFFRRVVAVWTSDAVVGPGRPGAGQPGASSEAGYTGGSRTRSPTPRAAKKPVGGGGLPNAVWRRIRELVSSPEDLVFLVMLVAFIGFAIHWLILIGE